MSTVTSSPSANDFLYGPTVPFEASDFAADPETVHSDYVERMIREHMPEYEPAAIDAGIDQAEAYANDQANRAAQTRAEIQTLTAAEERQRLEERRARIAFAGSVGRNLRAVRDQTLANRQSAPSGLFTFLQSKERRDAARVSRMSERQLIQAESNIGRTVFGPVAAGARREFFCLDEDTWIWHEEWTAGSKREVRTTRYEIRADDVIKSQDGERRSYVSDGELANLDTAMQMYYQKVMPGVYRRDPATGRPLIDAA